MIEISMLIAALALDLTLGELPASVHPVVWAGRLIAYMRRAPVTGPAAQLAYGVFMLALGLTLFALPAWMLLDYLRGSFFPGYFVLGTLMLKSTFSVRGLFSAAEGVRRPLAAGDLPEARLALRSLVSRDPSRLDAPLVAAAAVESVAENSSDSFVAPVFFFALFGVPGALFYRVANTYDSMVGYHGEYEYLGKAAARFDDLLNLVPARLTGLLLVVASALMGAGAGAWRAMLSYHSATESPNAGWPMAAMAGALDVRLEKVGHYRLGDGGSALTAATVARSQTIAAVALALATALFIATLLVRYAYFA